MAVTSTLYKMTQRISQLPPCAIDLDYCIRLFNTLDERNQEAANLVISTVHGRTGEEPSVTDDSWRRYGCVGPEPYGASARGTGAGGLRPWGCTGTKYRQGSGPLSPAPGVMAEYEKTAVHWTAAVMFLFPFIIAPVLVFFLLARRLPDHRMNYRLGVLDNLR